MGSDLHSLSNARRGGAGEGRAGCKRLSGGVGMDETYTAQFTVDPNEGGTE